ncbi:hypothetical protein VSDG_00573 [Cytospora chrysosperma]|uniref:FAM192A/Fyv6 N-terminal domain-containing protein n=1 Tax=Cytospora chrysosperma TaxID=252740 RepID=A0A423WPC7_CYTCH|nr:hypothetical protein VSDG_00573 [Valsa sordida]
MSSRFVSSGAIDTKTGDAVPVETQPGPSTSSAATTATDNSDKKSEQWAAVQAQLEAERLQRQRAREEAAGLETRSLFDVLQANKAAKQAAFEEANKIKNQFRPLDDDEVEFLEDVRSRRREEEERLRRETEEGLRGFRERQRLVGPGAGDGDEELKGGGDGGGGSGGGGGGGWSVGRKRKRRKDDHGDGGIKGLLKKRESGSAGDGGGKEDGKEDKKIGSGEAATTGTTNMAVTKTANTAVQDLKTTATAAPPPAKPKAGLVDYGSDDDSD